LADCYGPNRARRSSNEDVVSTVFYQGSLEGRGMTDGSADGVQASDGLDIVSVTPNLDDGSTYNLVIGVDQKLAVCGRQ
jgi:hypothetical protein